MAAESIGDLIPTAIPGYADAADIQAALRVYHYGSYAYNPANTSPGSLITPSMAKTIYDIQQDIVDLENRPSSGGDVANTAPVPGDFTPSGIPNGYIWVDQDGTIGGQPVSATSVFTNTPPTSELSTGVIWVDKDPTEITSNPFIPSAVISAKGDILIGTANDTASVLNAAATNGYVLSVNSSTTSGLEWITPPGDILGVTASTGLTGGGTSGTVSLAVDTAVVATTNNTLTLSNKTISGTSNTVTDISLTTSVTGTLPVANGGTGITSLGSGIGTFLGTPSSANLASAITDETGSGLLVFGTSPTITSALNVTPILRSPEERWNVSATAATGTVNFDANTSGILYYTSNASGNWTLNVRGDSGTSLNTMLSTNDSITVVFFVTNGATAYYQTGFQVDGNAVTPKWQNGTAPSAGNINSIDIYSYTIVKTGNAAFTAFGSQTKFA
jgi:hypothetical protein